MEDSLSMCAAESSTHQRHMHGQALEYRREIDGLRAVAVVPVILFHAGLQHFRGGFIGVDVFFVISGYLITSLIITERRAGTFTLVDFYERRARRILPALTIVTFCCLPLAWQWLLPTSLQHFSASLLSVLAFGSNIYFYLTGGYFGVPTEMNPLLHTWSLAVEEQFYLLLPVTLVILWRHLSTRGIVTVLSVLTLMSLALANHLSYVNPQFSFFLLLTRGWEILAGTLLAFYLLSPFAGRPQVRWVDDILSATGLLLIVYAIYEFDETTRWPSLHTIVPVAGTALIVLFANRGTLVARILGSRLLVGIGLLSYSAYLWHQPLFALERHRTLTQPHLSVMLGLALLSIALAYATWRYIEQPFRRKTLVSRKKALSILGICIAILAAIGATGVLSDGFPERLGQNAMKIQSIEAAINQDRVNAIREDACQFSNRTGIGIDAFVNQWNCKDDKNFPQLKRIPVIVTGDSHSADKAVALKANGFAPLQIGGSGCSIVPRYMRPDCRQIFSKLYEEIKHDRFYEYIVLANFFSEDELSLDATIEAVQFWRGFNKQIIWFTEMPAHPDLFAHLMRDLSPRMDSRISASSKRDTVLRYLRDSGVHVIDSEDIFCSINRCNYVDKSGCLLLTDDTHLSVWGARAFGIALLQKDSVFKRFQSGASVSYRKVSNGSSDDFFAELGSCYEVHTAARN